jgi:tRNA modification GTPase
VVEISCHGSPFIQDSLLQLMIQEGARLAKPGEFTQRAFLNAKLDLTQAEAVADLIASNTEASRQAALYNLKGGLSDDLKLMREKLIKFSALIELELDFSQEDVEFVDRKSLKDLLLRISVSVHDLLQSFQLGNVIKNGVSVAIVGKPNAGKSTLLNALLNENRAIVSAIAGTTRDTIEEVLNIDGILFRLMDTAGIREGTDEIETIGVEKSREKMRSADLVVYLFDALEETKENIEAVQQELLTVAKNWLMVGNKLDDIKQIEARAAYYQLDEVVFISAKEDKGLDQLRSKLTAKVTQGIINTENTIVTNARHFQSLQKVGQSIESINHGLENKLPGDLLAIDIRQCLHYLGEITGQISNEDQLDYIFSKFCIGK